MLCCVRLYAFVHIMDYISLIYSDRRWEKQTEFPLPILRSEYSKAKQNKEGRRLQSLYAPNVHKNK